MMEHWLHTLGVPLPVTTPAGVSLLLVDGDALLRAQHPAVAAAGDTVRMLGVRMCDALRTLWYRAPAATLLVAWDVPPDCPLGRVAGTPEPSPGNPGIPPVSGRKSPFLSNYSGNPGIPPELMPGLDGVVPADVTRPGLAWVVARFIKEHLHAPSRAPPGVQAFLLDAVVSVRGEQPTAHVREHMSPGMPDAWEAALVGRLVAESNPRLVRLVFAPDGKRPVTRSEVVGSAPTGHGEALVKLCAAAAAAAQSDARALLVTDHPDALVPALLTPAIQWLAHVSMADSAMALDPARRACPTALRGLLYLGLAAGCSSLSPPATPPPLVAEALHALVEGRVPERPRLVVPGDEDALAPAVQLLAYAAHRASPLRASGAMPSPLLQRRVAALRASGELPADTADPPSLNECLARARRAQWLMRYYTARTADDAAWLGQSMRAAADEPAWGWSTLVVPRAEWTDALVAKAASGRAGCRFEGHSAATLRIEWVRVADERVPVPLEAAAELQLFFG